MLRLLAPLNVVDGHVVVNAFTAGEAKRAISESAVDKFIVYIFICVVVYCLWYVFICQLEDD